jgi:hypothetical protein
VRAASIFCAVAWFLTALIRPWRFPMRTDARLEWCLMATILMIVMEAGIHVHLP